MKSNSDIKRSARVTAVLVGLVAFSVLAGSCMTARELSRNDKKAALDRGYIFSHAVHVEAGMDDCTVCHDPAAGNPTALSTPGHDLCSVCHEIPESNMVAPEDPLEQEKCTFCHTRPDYSVSPWKSSLSDEVKWQHAAHITAEISCATCHTELDTRSIATMPSKAFCMDCHQQSGPEMNACAVCHSTITMDSIPQFRNGERVAHDSPEIWKKLHGREARVDAAYCAMCHESQNRCDDCHSVMQPDDHTLAFKNRTHGHIASWDRNSCAACHDESFCVKCHQESTPASHHAGWAEPRNTHCVNCHMPAERTGCVVCHENIEHESARPSPHSVGIFPPNCAECHPGGLPHQAPHLLNSTVHCVVCHE